MITFYGLILVFFALLCQFFVPVFDDLLIGYMFFVPMALFCLLGIILLVLTLREKVGGKLRKFLLLIGVSATGFFVFALLHNFMSPLEKITEDIFILSYLIQGLSVIFFLLAVLICPIGFLVGLVGSIVLLIKKRQKR